MQQDPLFEQYERERKQQQTQTPSTDPLIAEYEATRPKSNLTGLITGEHVETAPRQTRAQAALAGIAQGMTFGFADELTAGIEAMMTDKSYDEALANRRQLYGEAREDHPGTMLSGEIAGGVAIPVGAGAIKGGTLAARMGAGAKAGAAGGSLAGFGSAEGNVIERLPAAATGAVLGGAVGGALPVVPAMGRFAADVTGVRPKTPRMPLPDGQELRYTGPASIDDIRGTLRSTQERADDKLLQAMDRGEVDIDALSRATGDKPETILDLAGQPALRLARGARSASPRASKQLDEYMTNRASGAEERILNDLLETTGQPGRTNTVQAFDDLIEARKAHAKPLYDKAYEATVQSDVVKEAVAIPEFRRAYEAGQRIARIEKRTLPDIEEGIKNGFPVEAIDYMKRGVDAVIEAGGESGRSMSRTEARALRNRLAEVLEDVDASVPAYKQARAQFAGDSELLEALDSGRSLFKMHPDEARKAVDNLSEAGKERFRQGAFEALADRIESIAPGNDISRRVAEKTLDKKRLRLLFSDDESFARFQDLIKREATMNASRNFLRGNSQTVDKLMELADLADVALTGMGSPSRVLDLFKTALTRGMTGNTQRLSEALVPRLTAEAGTDAFTELREAMVAAEQRRASQGARSARASGVAGRTTGAAAGSTQKRER